MHKNSDRKNVNFSVRFYSLRIAIPLGYIDFGSVFFFFKFANSLQKLLKTRTTINHHQKTLNQIIYSNQDFAPMVLLQNAHLRLPILHVNMVNFSFSSFTACLPLTPR